MTRISQWLVGVCVALVVGCQTLSDRSPAPPSIKQVNVNGVGLAYQEQGQGTPVVFVHGAVSDYRVWDAQREAIAAHYRFIATTQRYFGTGAWADSGAKFSLATHVDDLAAFIRELNVGPVQVVGWSYGGAIALVLAMQHPELVKSLFLFEPAPLGTIVTDAADAKAFGEDRKAAIGPAVAASKAGDLVGALRLFLDGVNDQPGAFDALPGPARAVFTDNARTIPLYFSAPPPPVVTCAQLAEIKTPVAIVKGELTRPLFRLIADTANRCMPKSQLIVIAKGRHSAPSQDPAAFNAALLAFLAKQ